MAILAIAGGGWAGWQQGAKCLTALAMLNLPRNLWQVEHTWWPRDLDATDVQEEASSAYRGLLCVICSHVTCNELLNGTEEAHTGILGREEDARCAWLVGGEARHLKVTVPPITARHQAELGIRDHG